MLAIVIILIFWKTVNVTVSYNHCVIVCVCLLVMAFPRSSTLDPDSQLVHSIGFYKFYQSTFIGVMNWILSQFKLSDGV